MTGTDAYRLHVEEVRAPPSRLRPAFVFEAKADEAWRAQEESS